MLTIGSEHNLDEKDEVAVGTKAPDTCHVYIWVYNQGLVISNIFYTT